MFLAPLTAAAAVIVSSSSFPSQVDSEPLRIEVESSPTRVTAYRQGAWVERTVSSALEAGHYRMIFSDLPVHWRPESIQASLTGNGRVVGIEVASREVSTAPARISNLADQVAAAREKVRAAENALSVRAASIGYLENMMARSADEDASRTGTTNLQIDAIQKQLKFFSEELSTQMAAQRQENLRLEAASSELKVLQSKLANAGSATTTTREAHVEIMVSEQSKYDVTLSYLVEQAQWRPRYDIRGDYARSSTRIEYRAEISQQTGEDWTDVSMVLSTARPSRAAHPPELDPVFINVVPLAPAKRPDGRSRGSYGSDRVAAAIAGGGFGGLPEAADARIEQDGSSVTYDLPRKITVASNSREARQTLIAQFQAPVDFTLVAVPILTEDVYLRGRFQNESDYFLLPGEAGIFMGGNYVGMTRLGSFAPQADMEMYFGADPTCAAGRIMLTKTTGESGVFGGWTRTDLQYVLKLENSGAQPVAMEVWDRRPVSQSDQIEVKIENLSQPLSTVAAYVRNEQPQGLLCWNVQVPGLRTGDNAFEITYDLQVEHREGIRTTPVPE